jgi:ADP-heptose:LPS heptosyltransferase
MEDNLIIPGVRKIAVMRALVLGDLIFSLPALEALHSTYPEAEIVYLGRRWHKDFVPGRVPGVRRVVPFNPSPVDYEDLGFLIDPHDARSFFQQMQAEQFDLALQMHGGGHNANPFVRRLGARVTIGSREAKAIPLDRWIPYDYHQTEVIRWLDLVALAGAQPVTLHPRLALLDSDRAAAQPFLDGIRRPFVVIHAGARDVRRRYPAEQFAQVADAMKRQLGVEVVLTGADFDAEAANAVEAAMQETAVNLSNGLSLPALMGLLSEASLLISNDTGPLHLGLALGTPAVGLFWVEYVIKSLPLGRKNFTPLIAWNRHCPLCGQFLDYEGVTSSALDRPCKHETSFVDSIRPDEVIEAAALLLYNVEMAYG